MQDKLELSLLMDYYGAFLTDNQRELITMSSDEDYSLSEIAEEKGISRQGVRDALLRGEKQLYDMEKKLGLVARDRCALAVIDRIKDEVSRCGADADGIKRITLLLAELAGILEGSDGI